MKTDAAHLKLCESVIDNCDLETLEELLARAKKKKVNAVMKKAAEFALAGDKKAFMAIMGTVVDDCDEEDLDKFAAMNPASPDYIMGMVAIFGGELVKSVEGLNFAAVEKAYGPEWYKLKVDALGQVV